MDAKTKKKAQQLGLIVGGSMLGLTVLNTLANRFQLAARVRDIVANGF